jgi:hypothetical protein
VQAVGPPTTEGGDDLSPSFLINPEEKGTMTLNDLIRRATEISRKFTTGEIPLRIYGTEVDVTLTEQEDGKGNYYIEVNYVPTPKEKPREIIRQAVTPIGSDCTQGFVVQGAEGMTIREFIAYICEKYKSEHGDFRIMFADDGETYGTLLRCCYHDGSIDAKSIADKDFEKAMNLTIDNIHAGGGWGAMDYTIYSKIEK